MVTICDYLSIKQQLSTIQVVNKSKNQNYKITKESEINNMIKFVKEQIERLVEIGDKKYLTEVRKTNGLRVNYCRETSAPGRTVKHLCGRIKNNNEVKSIVILAVNSTVETIDITGNDGKTIFLNLRGENREKTINDILYGNNKEDSKIVDEELDFREYLINEENGFIDLEDNISVLDGWRKTKSVILAEIEDNNKFKLIDKNGECYAEMTKHEYFNGKLYIWNKYFDSLFNEPKENKSKDNFNNENKSKNTENVLKENEIKTYYINTRTGLIDTEDNLNDNLNWDDLDDLIDIDLKFVKGKTVSKLVDSNNNCIAQLKNSELQAKKNWRMKIYSAYDVVREGEDDYSFTLKDLSTNYEYQDIFYNKNSKEIESLSINLNPLQRELITKSLERKLHCAVDYRMLF